MPDQLDFLADETDLGVRPCRANESVAAFTRKHHRAGGKPTSQAAAADVAEREARGPTAKNCQGRILWDMVGGAVSGAGATSDELESRVIAYAHQRLCDLESLGFIRDTKATRLSRKGVAMTVYRITDKGRAWIAAQPGGGTGG